MAVRQINQTYLDNQSSVPLSFLSNVAPHSTIVVCAFSWPSSGAWNPLAADVTDNINGGGYALPVAIFSDAPMVGIWYRYNVSGGPTQLTITPNAGGANHNIGFSIIELDPAIGYIDPLAVGQTAQANEASDTPDPGTVTPDVSGKIAFSAITIISSGLTDIIEPSGYTPILDITNSNQDGAVAYRVVPTTADENPIWNVTRAGGTGSVSTILALFDTGPPVEIEPSFFMESNFRSAGLSVGGVSL